MLLGGRIVTLDDARPGAAALAARDGRIVAVGSDEEVRRLVGPDTEVLELEGRLAIPGFVECHGHFTGLGRSMLAVDLRAERTWDAVIERVAAAAAEAPPGRWVVGWGWHQAKWDRAPEPALDGYPLHHELSRRTPDHPVLLKHAAGSHAGLANARALALAGIDGTTPDPPGGEIVRDATGEPSGLLREAAFALVEAAHQRDREAAESRADWTRTEIELADRECMRQGVTTFHDAGTDFATVDVMREMAGEGALAVRLWVMLAEENDALERRIADYAIDGAGDGHLTVRGIKRLVDGALGTHTAWLLEPYADERSTSGIEVTPLPALERTARIAARNDFQLCVHAIGDRANREVLDLYEQVLGEVERGRDRRWRVEHAQHLHPDDAPRFAELGVVASMQPIHCTSDAPWVVERLGERRAADGAYVWRTLLDSGAVLCSGTDAPVEELDPIANFHAAVTRQTASGAAFYPGQSMSRVEALRAATANGAWAAFEERDKGSLAAGKLADVVVLSEDILEVPEDRIRDARVVYTIVGGAVRYRER